MARTRREGKNLKYSNHYFPPEIWEVILTMLPVKALLRFRCVSKTWLSFIHSPEFALRQMTHNPENTKDQIFTVQCLREEIKCLIRNGGNDFAKIAEVGLCCKKNDYINFNVVGYVNGVVCLKFFKDIKLLKIGLSNPSIKKFIDVPLPNMFDKVNQDGKFGVRVDVAIGFDYVRNCLKLLAIGNLSGKTGEHARSFRDVPISFQVYGLGERSWRTIHVPDVQDDLFSEWSSPKVFFNRAVHWIPYGDRLSIRLRYSRVVAFDMSNEVFSYFELPEIGEGMNNYRRLPVVCKESLGVMDMLGNYLKLWIMRQYGVKESWATFYKLEISPDLYQFVCVKKDGEVLYRDLANRLKLMVYDNVDVWKFVIMNLWNRGESQCGTRYFSIDPCFTDKYVESLLLLE